MKKIIALTAMSASLAGVIATHAGADVPRTGATAAKGTIAQVLGTKIAGTFTVPTSLSSELAGFACSNIYIGATSKDTIPPPPGSTFATPKWTRGAAATGTYSSGKCSYSFTVPSNSPFYLNTGVSGNFLCGYMQAWIGTTGAAIGPISVPLGTTKTQNFAVTKVVCDWVE